MKPSSLLEGTKYKFTRIVFQITFHCDLTLVSWLSTNTEDEEDLDDSATEETKIANGKKKFLEDLEESDVEKEKSEKEETDEEEESSSSEEESDDEFDPNDSDDDVKKKGFMAKKASPKRKAPAGRGRGGALKMPTVIDWRVV